MFFPGTGNGRKTVHILASLNYSADTHYNVLHHSLRKPPYDKTRVTEHLVMFGFGKSSSKNVTKGAKAGFQSTKGSTVLVTGSSGFVGARLVEMLLERGAKTVICFDIVTPNDVLQQRFYDVQKMTSGKLVIKAGKEGDITNQAVVDAAFASVKQIDMVYHIAALVGPFHPHELYRKVNYDGTMNILNACRTYKVPKLVNSSSPSTRFTGKDIEGASEDDLYIPETFLAAYAESKAYAEKEVTKACCDQLLTINVAPHQVYGPHDGLFVPKLMETCGSGRLRIFGNGKNMISVCYVDNYCHGLMCGADTLAKGSPSLGKFYIITDEKPVMFWKMINQAALKLGFADLEKKFHLPVLLLYFLAYFCNFLGYLLNKNFKLNPFNVKMLTIHRYFSIDNARRDLGYEPLVLHDEAWNMTIEWFRVYWLPQWKVEGSKDLGGKKLD